MSAANEPQTDADAISMTRDAMLVQQAAKPWRLQKRTGSVLQPWVERISFMQQSVLLTAVRGPDGIHKDHIAKVLLRWYRRCILFTAFDGAIYATPDQPGGGSFTGPIPPGMTLDDALDQYLRCVDELPHHYQLHFMHAAEIIGYKHPDPDIRAWWNKCYLRLVNDAHLYPESEALMDRRLGDNERQWREREEVVAAHSGVTQ